MNHHRRPAWAKLALLVGSGLALLGTALVTLRAGGLPDLGIESDRPGIGRRTRLTVRAREDGRGLGALRVELVQGERRVLLAERSHTPRPAWAPWAPRTTEDTLEVEVGRDVQPELEPGEAVVRVTATRAGTWLRAPDPVVRELRLPVRLAPPSLTVLSTHNYAAQGGSGVVRYQVGAGAARDGVQAGEWWSPGAALPAGAAGERFALFAVPYDLTDAAAIRLVVVDDLGNRAEQPFVERYFERPMGREPIHLSDAFMRKVVPEILARTPGLREAGDLLQTYLLVNGELRRRNAAAIEQLGGRSRPEFLWSRPFLPMPNAKVMSAFADRRSYVYEGRQVDQQDHLGFDLASVRGASVPASNAGVVALAEYLGIYGNTVVVDHGYGLMTLYAHLSAVDVVAGQAVERGQAVGRTGETGLAGGDHLHFTVLLHGRPVSPVDWWDAKWIRDRVAPKLGAALPFEPAADDTVAEDASRPR